MSPLTEHEITTAALALVDEVGVTGFTMRALATRLGTYPATLYWHVGNRNEILAAVFQLVMSEMQVPDPHSMVWDQWLEVTAREYRRTVHQHPNTAVLALYPLVTSADVVEAILTALHRGGFRGPALADAFNVFAGSVTGWVAVELSAAGGEPDQQWRSEFEARVRGMPADRYPTITANVDHVADRVFTLRWHGGAERPLDRSFEAALQIWLDGLRAQVRRKRR